MSAHDPIADFALQTRVPSQSVFTADSKMAIWKNEFRLTCPLPHSALKRTMIIAGIASLCDKREYSL